MSKRRKVTKYKYCSFYTSKEPSYFFFKYILQIEIIIFLFKSQIEGVFVFNNLPNFLFQQEISLCMIAYNYLQFYFGQKTYILSLQ